MRHRLPNSIRWAVCAVAIAAAAWLAQYPSAAAPKEHENWPTQVRATYKVTFNGFEIGDFHFESNITSDGYTADGHAELSALMGAFKWEGTTRSAGKVVNDRPKPAGYIFDYKSNSKLGSVKMSFNEAAAVSNVSILPPRKPNKEKRLVPVQAHHLKEVLDPLSAVLALTHGSTVNPCGRKLSIFDGKQRFDLVLSFRGQQRITEAVPSGQPGIAFVCRVRYVPIAGHKPDDEDTKSMAGNGNIEIMLRPVPSANMVVPYRVKIPMLVGSAELVSQRVEIVTSNRRQIALTN